jgi:hypothetical protein
MNRYMLDLISSCSQGRRESIRILSHDKTRLFLLPNGKLEGMIEDYWTDGFSFFKNGRLILRCKYAHRGGNLEFQIQKSGTCLSVGKGGYIFFFLIPNFQVPFEINPEIDRYASFNSVLSSFNLSQVPLLVKGRNYTLRTLTPTLIDELMED